MVSDVLFGNMALQQCMLGINRLRASCCFIVHNLHESVAMRCIPIQKRTYGIWYMMKNRKKKGRKEGTKKEHTQSNISKYECIAIILDCLEQFRGM
jgi:hypothetical protein